LKPKRCNKVTPSQNSVLTWMPVEIIWDHFVSVFSRESKRTLPVTKLNTDAIYLNNFSKMRVNLAVNTLSLLYFCFPIIKPLIYVNQLFQSWVIVIYERSLDYLEY
jgi:TRAP-type mannitol/chloroaromatic compound transport system permease small subunit